MENEIIEGLIAMLQVGDTIYEISSTYLGKWLREYKIEKIDKFYLCLSNEDTDNYIVRKIGTKWSLHNDKLTIIT